MYFPCEREDGYFRWGTMEGRQRRLLRHPHEVRHHDLAEGCRRQLDRGKILPGARHLLRRDLSRFDTQRRAAGLHQRRRAAAHARRRRRRHRRQISGARGYPRRRHARLRRHGAHLPRSVQVRARHPPMQGLQPERRAPRSFRRGDVAPAQHGGARGRQRRARRCAAPICCPVCTDSMQPVYDAEWIEKGMHVTNLGRREMPDAATDKFDVVVRQGTAGLQMKQTERFQAERGLSPAAFIGGTVEEMKRIPEKNPQPGFGGDSPEFMDRGKRRRQAGFRRSGHRQVQGSHQPRPGDVLPQRRQSGPAVFLRRRLGLRAGRQGRKRPRHPDRVVFAGYSRLTIKEHADACAEPICKARFASQLMLALGDMAHAQTLDEFYKGKTISLLIGFGVGGEDDLWARTIARHLGNHIPGNPTVVPQNAPGSGGLLVANRLYNTVAQGRHRYRTDEPRYSVRAASRRPGRSVRCPQIQLHRQPGARHHRLRRAQGRRRQDHAGFVHQGAYRRRYRLGRRYRRSIRSFSRHCLA